MKINSGRTGALPFAKRIIDVPVLQANHSGAITGSDTNLNENEVYMLWITALLSQDMGSGSQKKMSVRQNQ